MAQVTLPLDLPGIRGPVAFRPETARPLNELVDVPLRRPHFLTPGERELIATSVPLNARGRRGHGEIRHGGTEHAENFHGLSRVSRCPSRCEYGSAALRPAGRASVGSVSPWRNSSAVRRQPSKSRHEPRVLQLTTAQTQAQH